MMNINIEKCIGCGQCVKDCFPKDIEIVEGKARVRNVTCMKCGHCIAVCPAAAVSTDDYNMEDVKIHNKEEFTIDADHLLNFIKFRRTIRQFKDQPVEAEKISKIIEAGRFTQTGSNLQDVAYIVVSKRLEELKALALEGLKKLGEEILSNVTPQNLLVKRYANMWIKMYEDYKENSHEHDRLFFNAPSVIIITANSDVSGALASSNMELMTNALGLGTFFSGFFVRAAKGNQKILDFLGVEEGKQIATCMVIGYPNVKYLRTAPRKEADISWK